MKSGLLQVFIGVICLTLLTACGSSKSVLTGDFTEFEGSLDGVTLELVYYSRLLAEQVVLGSGTVKENGLEVIFYYDDQVPRWAILFFTFPEDLEIDLDPSSSLILERGANYTLEFVEAAESFFRVESDGKYAHIFVHPLEVELEQRELENKFSKLRQQDAENSRNIALATNEEDSSAGTVRQPSKHAAVLDWETMNCADYAGEYEQAWDSEFINPDRLEQSPAVKEVRRQLDEFYEQTYDRPLRTILDSSKDPIERLLFVEIGYTLEADEAIQVFEQLESELADHVVVERVHPILNNLRRRREQRLANEALKLGTMFPSIEIALIDQKTTHLSSILQENQIVVLDLWDNYCLSCLKGFERYKSFYTDFENLGFEVVSLSLEDNHHDWMERSEELNYPWINAHAPNDEISKLLGVQFPRANFVLDSDGCILKRNLTPDELLDFLGVRLGL